MLQCVVLGAKEGVGKKGTSVDEREQIRSAGANLAGFHPVTKGDNRASKKERKTRALQSNDTPRIGTERRTNKRAIANWHRHSDDSGQE